MTSTAQRPRRLGAVHRLRSGARARIAALLLGVLAAVPAAAQQPQQAPRIGYVDMQRLIDNAPQVIDVRARLATEFHDRDLKLKADERRLADLEVTAAGNGADPALGAQVDALRRSVERERRRLREELNTRRQQEEDEVLPVISETVAEFAREEGYDLVLQMPVIYVSGRIDITDRVLDRLRQSASEPSP